MKEYFSHDYNARQDEKIKRLIAKHGMLGYGIYWSMIENLYNNANALQTDYDVLAYELHEDIDRIKSIINDFNLFSVVGEFFHSESVGRRLQGRNIKSEKAKQSAYSRWNNPSDANVMQTQCDSNAIKEKKRKENNINKKKINKKEIDFSFVNINFLESFQKWLNYKKDRKETYKSEESLKTCYEKLLKLSGSNPEIFLEIINQSIANNWAGIFPLKNNINGSNRQIESDTRERVYESSF